MARIQELQFKEREREKGEREWEKRTHRRTGTHMHTHAHTCTHSHTHSHTQHTQTHTNTDTHTGTHSGARTPSHAHTGSGRCWQPRLHREPLLPSTASRCKHRHPICVGVNWLFDVSRKVLPLERSQSPLLPRFPACALK